MKKESNQDETSYLFNVDVLVKGRSNVEALQFLLNLLTQHEQIADSRVQSGIELGNLIEAALHLKKQSAVNGSSDAATALAEKFSKKKSNVALTNKPPAVQEIKQAHVQPKPASQQELSTYDWIKRYIHDNTLVRLIVNRYGGQRSIPCRILNLDHENNLLSVYHVDEKQVYSFKMNEIDEITS
ncbi:hypothetical protein HPL003_15910 [Paenibacillus terrae HPL-003]|uniref:Uncharacterized protein n=1 Tax=Paenibacillus terrae (strain HPL-003) TaxID=985665 RepID=G7VZ74_PAETH|nr:hypothetical protein [Paenibacillus terrae]AET59930.1 hypothetical protein HPL003_15910 [Paenibacillus terrae HPL-003]